MKIAILGTKGIPGHHGVEVVVEALVPHLAQLGHELTVYGYAGYVNGRNSYKGAWIMPVKGLRGKNVEMISHMGLAAIASRRCNYDIIHIHSTDPCLLSWLPRAHHGIIATSHGQAYLREKWSKPAKMMSQLAEFLYAYLPRKITSVSKPLARYYEKKYNRKVHYIPNGITLRTVPSSRYLNQWGLEKGAYLFCSAGRIERTKGIHTLIKAYRNLNPDMPLVIAGGGSGSDAKYYESLRERKPTQVHFVGFLSGDALFSLYAHAAAFIFPSEYEAMSMALLEGLSFGTPTIFSDLPENKVVAEGVGFAFRSGDASALAQRIGWVLANPEAAKQKGTAAKQHIRVQHNWKVIARQYHDLYMEMAGSRSR